MKAVNVKKAYSKPTQPTTVPEVDPTEPAAPTDSVKPDEPSNPTTEPVPTDKPEKPEPELPDKVTGVTLDGSVEERLTIKWKGVSCCGYDVMIAKDDNFTLGVRTYTGKITRSQHTFYALKPGTYYVKVCAFGQPGDKFLAGMKSDKYPHGEWSDVVSCTVKAIPPYEPLFKAEENKWYVDSFRADENLTMQGGQEMAFRYHYSEPMYSSLYVESASSSDEELLFLTRGGTYGYWVNVYAVKDGTVDLTINYKNGESQTFHITIIGEDDYYAPYTSWRDKWISENITSEMSTMEKVQKVVGMVMKFKYETGYIRKESLYKHGGGTCMAGNDMLDDFLNKMGIRSEFRFAGDDEELYGVDYGQGGWHYNCWVWIDGVKYMCDGTPKDGYGMMIIKTWDSILEECAVNKH